VGRLSTSWSGLRAGGQLLDIEQLTDRLFEPNDRAPLAVSANEVVHGGSIEKAEGA
jgi:hypothetical protein